MAVVRLWVEPRRKVTVFLDGYNIGDTSEDDGVYTHLSPGEHVIEVKNQALHQIGVLEVYVDDNSIETFKDYTKDTGDAYTINIPVENNIIVAKASACYQPTPEELAMAPSLKPCDVEGAYLCDTIYGQCGGTKWPVGASNLYQCTNGRWRMVERGSKYCPTDYDFIGFDGNSHIYVPAGLHSNYEPGVEKVCTPIPGDDNPDCNYAMPAKEITLKVGGWSIPQKRYSHLFTDMYEEPRCKGPGPLPATGVQWGLWGATPGRMACVPGTQKCVVERSKAIAVDKEGYPTGETTIIRKRYTCQPDGARWTYTTSIGDSGPCAGYPEGTTYLTPEPHFAEPPHPTSIPRIPTTDEIIHCNDVLETTTEYLWKCPALDKRTGSPTEIPGPYHLAKVPGYPYTGSVTKSVDLVLGITEESFNAPTVTNPYPPTTTTVPTTTVTTTTVPTTTVTTTTVPTTTVQETLPPVSTPYPPTLTPQVTTSESQVYSVDQAAQSSITDNMPLLIGAAAVVLIGVMLLRK